MAVISGKSVIGLNVVTIDNGKIIETVDDIAYNPTTHRVEALLVSSGGLFSSAQAVHMDDVKNVGEDAVIVHDASAMKSIKELDESSRSISESNKHLVKTNVLTVEGKELGKVTDIFFDSETGNVSSMEVSQGGLKTLSEGKKSIKSEDIVTIGADATIVSTYTEMKLEEQGEEGGLKGVLNTAKDKASEVATDAKDKLDDAVESGKDNAQKLKVQASAAYDDAKDNASEALDRAGERANELKHDAEVKSRELREDIEDKSEELRRDGQKSLDDAKKKSDELAEVAQKKSDELVASTRSKGNDLQREAKKVATNTKEKAEDVKKTIETESRSKSITDSSEGREVVERTKKTARKITK